MFENILKTKLKICEYSRNNQQSYDDAFFNQLRITISILLIELSKLLVYFNFRRVKLHYVYVEETHMMLVVFRRRWKLLQHLSTKDNERNFCQDWQLKTPTRTSLKVHALHYMQMSYSKTFANSPNKQKRQVAIKNRFWLWLSIVWGILKLNWC